MRSVVLLVVTVATALPQSKISYEKDVQPILAQKCYSCHGEAAQQAGLRLDRRQTALRGGDYGPVIVAGDSAKSKLIRRISNGDGGLIMPPTGKLSDDEIATLRAWIDQGVDWSNKTEDDTRAKPVDPKLIQLISAVRDRDGKAVHTLLAEQPDLVKAQDTAGNTALHHAAGFGDLATVKLLLDKGGDPNAKNLRLSTPLFWALYDEAKVRLLLSRGANVNAKSNDGRTALYNAASMANAFPVMRMLLDKGADPNAKTLNGTTPLMAAARMSVEGVRVLLDAKAEVNAKGASGFTALMSGASSGDPAIVRLLLDKGADPKVRTKKNETALGYAGTAGNDESVKLLLDHGAEVNVADVRGYTPLLYAAGSDAMPAESVKMMLAKGADAKAKGDDETAAELAAKRGNSEVARVLGVSLIAAAATPSAKVGSRSIAEAVGPALSLLEKQSANFIRIGGCNSCHAQDLPSAAAAIARDHGLPAPKSIPQLPLAMRNSTPSRMMDVIGFGAGSVSWETFNFGMNHMARDEYIDAAVHYIKVLQSPEGNWRQPHHTRPPMSSGEYQAAAFSIYTLKTYGRPVEKEENERVIARAAGWLEQAKPTNTQDRAFQVMGLVWAGAGPAAIASAVKSLVAMQREDGGWSQLPTMSSDAYATGEALYALHLTGKIAPAHPSYAKGMNYLLRTQAADGTWHVKTRSIWLQPYFESGFPYGHDQWISAAGTAWATIALSVTVEPARMSRALD